MTTEYRAALAELIDAVDRLLGQGESPANPGQRLILTVHVEDLGAIAERARTLLATPEVVGVTDEELFNVMSARGERGANSKMLWLQEDDFVPTARELLTRFGTAQPALVPVSERLPDRNDLDPNAYCWFWDGSTWERRNKIPMLPGGRCVYSHWLPHWALPLPGVEA